MSKFLADFKQFIMKGNVFDMAIGIIIGGAFGKIVSSMVNDIIMPVVGLFVGGIDFQNLKYTLKAEELSAKGEVLKPAVTLNYGNFIQQTVDFLIIALCIFLFLRLMMNFKKKKVEASAAPPAPSAEEVLLTEIRDILKNKQS